MGNFATSTGRMPTCCDLSDCKEAPTYLHCPSCPPSPVDTTAIEACEVVYEGSRVHPEVAFSVVLCASFRLHAQLSFFQPPSYSGADQIYVVDFNQDGKLDLLASDGTMNLGKGDGTFSAGTNVTIPSGGSVLAVADFNGHGKPDVLE